MDAILGDGDARVEILDQLAPNPLHVGVLGVVYDGGFVDSDYMASIASLIIGAGTITVDLTPFCIEYLSKINLPTSIVSNL